MAWQEDPCGAVSDGYHLGGLRRRDSFGQVGHHVGVSFSDVDLSCVLVLKATPFFGIPWLSELKIGREQGITRF